MAEDHDDLYADDRHENHETNDYENKNGSHMRRHSLGSGSLTDTTSDSDSEDTNQIGRALATSPYQTPISSPLASSSFNRDIPYDSHDGTLHFHSPSGTKSEGPTSPQSRPRSIPSSPRSSLAPTAFVPSKQDRLRYSWQSLADDDDDRPCKPRIHVIKVVSAASTASAGIGQEEAFGFSISNGGKRIAVYNSARIFILQTAALPVNVSQEYALKRRPLAVAILDADNVLAVLTDEHTVNVYDTSHQRVRRIKTIRPDHPTYTIALSPTGALLAAAYQGGIEIFSLAQDALSTDRRAIRCQRMDKLTFSDDGSALLGTTTRLHASSTVLVSVPVFPSAENGVPTPEELREAWCTGLLNPENIRNSSHATFWREQSRLCNEKIFAWNGLEDTFGVLHTPNLEYSNITCPIGVSQPLSAVGGLGAAISSAPSVDESGISVAMIVNSTTVRIYTIPQNVAEDEQRVEAHSLDHELNDEYGCPFADVRWVHMHKSIAPRMDSEPKTRGRLIVTSPGGMFDPEIVEQNIQDVEGGRIIMFDFDPQYAGQPGQIFTFTLGKAPPQPLEEESLDVAAAVDLVRRRTITQSRSGALGQRPPSLGRTATSISRRREDSLREHRRGSVLAQGQTFSLRNTPIQEHASTHFFGHLRGGQQTSICLSSEATRSLPDLLEGTELAYEQPYTQGAPRSGGALQRAATNATRYRIQAIEEREAAISNPEGLPLPAYTEVPNQPLPAKFRKLAGLDIPVTGRILYNPEIVTAPPSLSEVDHYSTSFPFPFPSSTQIQTVPTLSDPVPRNMQHVYHANATHGISPVGPVPPPVLFEERGNVSPLLTHTPTIPGPRHQISWETLSAQQTNAPYSFSQHSHSPISRTTTHTTLHSQRSFDGCSPSTLQSQFQQSSALPISTTLPLNQTATNGLGNSFRHSALLPLDQDYSPVEVRPPSAASTTAARSPARGGYAIMNANGNPNSYYRALYQRQTPFQRVGSVSAGSVAHPITGWYPPAPSAPPAGNHASNSASTTSPTLARSGGTNERSTISSAGGSSSLRSRSANGSRSGSRNAGGVLEIGPSGPHRPSPTFRAGSAPQIRTVNKAGSASGTASPALPSASGGNDKHRRTPGGSYDDEDIPPLPTGNTIVGRRVTLNPLSNSSAAKKKRSKSVPGFPGSRQQRGGGGAGAGAEMRRRKSGGPGGTATAAAAGGGGGGGGGGGSGSGNGGSANRSRSTSKLEIRSGGDQHAGMVEDRYKLRAEFREIERQGKRCVVM